MKEENSKKQRLVLPHLGDRAPEFSLPATDDTLVELSIYPKPVALVFLRHLA